jgi:putative phosphoesterase
MTTSEPIRRVAALYDVHGNLPALEAVLAELERDQPDLIVFGGDVALGPLPRQTLDRLLGLGERARFIRGNTDRELVRLYDRARGTPGTAASPPGSERLAWAADQPTPAQRDFLAGLPEHFVVEISGLGQVLFCHGSPRSDEEILTRITSEPRLRTILANVSQPVVVCGHTHMQFDRRIDGQRVVNAGSVGMPYEAQPGAYWVLLGPHVVHRRTPYDLEAAAKQIRASGFPNAEEFATGNVLSLPSPEEATARFEKMATGT